MVKPRVSLMSIVTWKNYALRGEDANEATSLTQDEFEDKVEQGWFSCKVDRKTFKNLIKRTDSVPLAYLGLWLGLLVATGIVAYMAWDTWWALPAFFVYGVLYSAADHRHHELSHGTPFKTRWINDCFFHLCAFMTLREALQVALRSERKAFNFFTQALDLMTEGTVKTLFLELRDEEVEHQVRVLGELDKTPPDPVLRAEHFVDEPVPQ